jgi:small subunit ribosomal protein S17
MEASKGKTDLAVEPRPAKLVGYVNPLGIIPSFLLPVFERNGAFVLQESDVKEKIKGFYPYDEDEFGEMGRVSLDISAEEGEDVIYGFIFPSGSLVVGTREVITRRLLKERRTLRDYPFLYMEVLDFLEHYRDLNKEIEKVEVEYADNPLLGSVWTRMERKSIPEKKTPFSEPSLTEKENSTSSKEPEIKLGINLPRGFVKRVAEQREKERGKRAQRVGIVSSDKMTKTVVVRVDRLIEHPKYRRYVRRTSKFMAHDELGASIGDKVRIVETRPLSARKRWRVVEIIQKSHS